MVDLDEIPEKIRKWLEDVGSELKIGEEDLADLEAFLQSEFDKADSVSDSEPTEAYARVIRIADISSRTASKRPFLIRLFMKYLQRFVDVMKRVQKSMGAISFSISVSFPFNVSITITF